MAFAMAFARPRTAGTPGRGIPTPGASVPVCRPCSAGAAGPTGIRN